MRQSVAIALGLLAAGPLAADDPVRFNRDIRPILSEHCYQCHGPDAGKRKANLRLDREGAKVIAPGKPDESELVRRITSKDPDERMPPASAARDLSAGQIETLRRWVAEGAKWEKHWAFIAPVRPDPPGVKNERWTQNPIDRFVLARLEKAGLTPSPEAEKSTLIRRLSFDLTGLPPMPEEVDVFVHDKSPDAVDRLTDRLLASPRYGERMAWRWLEAARYADTHGYQTDGPRDMYRWRDWVIEAYNRNLPFDQFTIEQLAGDLLPNPTLDQRIATGFNRNHRGNSEGGIVPEEYAVEYVADRVETTATVWLGLTFTCARCHDHKFDPFTQKEFYRLFAFFNNVPEKGRAVKIGNSPPYIKAPTREQVRRLAELEGAVREAEERVAVMSPAAAKEQRRWEDLARPVNFADWTPDRGLVGYWSMDDTRRLTFSEHSGTLTEGRIGWALVLDGKSFADGGNIGDFGFDDRFSFAFWVKPRQPNGAILSRMVEEPRGEGYSVALVNGKLEAHFTKRWLDDALRIKTQQSLELNRWYHVVVTYDGSRLAAGTKIYIDGEEAAIDVLLDELNQSFQTKEPLRLGTGGGTESRFNGLLDDVRVYSRELDPAEARILSASATPWEIVSKPQTDRSAAEKEKLRAYFIAAAAPNEIREAITALRNAREARKKFFDAIPTVMVMEEMPTQRDAFVLARGQYDKKGDKVGPGVPAVLPALRTPVANAPGSPSRLDLARWIVSPDNPLTARVAVNRIWQLHFGTGLVKTAEDFGTQGDYPSHPELLDWLAAEFVRSGWDVKHMHKLIVTSATYRQSSRVTREEGSRLLARFPRSRLSAEMIRDLALFASGLLVEQPGGPSVKPYQPPGLWNELSGTGDYEPDTGDKLYRRSLYTFWKRTVAPPTLAAFDTSGRETCWVRETRTNTPIQALTLLNDVTYVEAARLLAERVLKEATSLDERLKLAFRRVTAREPTENELGVLRRGLERHLADYGKDPASAATVLRAGESKADPKIDRAELAAYLAICRLIMNLDEAVTRE